MTSQATQILLEISAGDRSRVDQLAECLYDEFRRLASSYLKDTKGNSLQPTVVVHAAFMKLVQQDVGWQGKSHFFAVGAVAMRQILVDHARRKAAQKRGGGIRRIIALEVAAGDPESQPAHVPFSQCWASDSWEDLSARRALDGLLAVPFDEGTSIAR